MHLDCIDMINIFVISKACALSPGPDKRIFFPSANKHLNRFFVSLNIGARFKEFMQGLLDMF